MGELTRDAKSMAEGAAKPSVEPNVEWSLRVLKLENRLQRERSARLQAEAIAEKNMRELYDKRRALELLEAIAAATNMRQSVERTFAFTVEAVCRHAGWQFGNVYVLSPDAPLVLVPAGIFHAENADRLAPFAATSGSNTFMAGVGLPGRVLASGRACWVRDVAAETELPCAVAARACGLHAAFAFPVLIGTEVVAVLEFFHRDQLEPDETLLGLVSQIGTQLGRVMERKRAEDKLVHDATHDPLTGLPNRALFTKHLEAAVALNAYGGPSADFAVFFIDLDHFKLVNDSLGHAAGDAMLLEIASRLSAALAPIREGREAILARLGGDEFTVLLEGQGSISAAERVAGSMLAALRPAMSIMGHEIHSTASIGVATSAAGLPDAAAIMRNADLAMYRAKAEGRSRVEVFDASLHALAKRRLSLEHDLRRALDRGEFVLHHQPIVSLAKNNRLVAFEALLRWKHEDRLVPPGEFIDLAEESGLIVPIGGWVLEEACRMAAAIHRIHPEAAEPGGTRAPALSLNVSPRQFRQPDFVARVREAVEEAGAPPDMIYLEITEGMFMESTERSAASLIALREFGVHFSIDDFGTGYSSLSYLHRLPVDVVKIDRSFVQGMDGRAGNGPIVQAIVDMARNLDLAVVAEGVETLAQAETLGRLGCQFGQGRLFSGPLDATAALDLLAARSPLVVRTP